MAYKHIQENDRVGIWLTANRGDYEGQPDIPDGTLAAICTSNDAWFVVDTAGNVRGNPEAVEREALSLDIGDNLIARGIVGLARLASRVRRLEKVSRESLTGSLTQSHGAAEEPTANAAKSLPE